MDTYRAVFALDSPCLTPWRADTLFGHLCWALARLRGDDALAALLEQCEAGDPPLLISDGMPHGLLPRPLVPQAQSAASTVAERIAGLRAAKEARARRWLRPDEFRRVIEASPEPVAGAEAEDTPFYTLHNQIHRGTGATTGNEDDETGRLFAVSGVWLDAVDVYVRVRPDADLPWVAMIEHVAQSGYGKRRSSGYGSVRSVTIEPFDGFAPPEGADGFVTLSACVPAADDPTRGFWMADVKHGRLGEERAASSRPFKRPVVRLLAGSAFRTGSAPRLWYGRMVPGVSPAFPDVVDYGLAFAVALRWPDGAEEGDD
ncbi:MAG: hypothetical protein GX446_00550 [Chthonomonadales bacterium]|nr:hypothetical protein [Chthonomonadales bacterium]